MTLEELIKEGNDVLSTAQRGPISSFVNESLYEPWKRKALMFVQENYPSHPQTKTFEDIVGHNSQPKYCRQLVSILQAFVEVKPTLIKKDFDGILKNLFERFHIIARQLLRRYSNRQTLSITDEYDVQDLLHALLKEHFDDVRPEEWTPSYAGNCNRMDFLLIQEKIAIEVKMTRKGLGDKELGAQLIIDIAKYQSHPNCRCLYCFVYDPEGIIRNPRGIEKDLAELGKGFLVKVFIRPE